MSMKTYAAYAANTADEMPLYLFDKEFVTAAPSLAADFEVCNLAKMRLPNDAPSIMK